MAIPKNFSVFYTFSNGSLPPPHHYETAIRIEPGKPAVYEFRPGYSGLESGAQLWKAPIPLTEMQRGALYMTLIKLGIERNWKADPRPPVGGSYRSLTVVTAKGKFLVPAFPIAPDRARAEKLFAAVTALVPGRAELEFMGRFQNLGKSSDPGIR
jgi:hypothetical protein